MITDRDFELILSAGNPTVHDALILLAGLACAWFHARDSRGWELSRRERIRVLLVVTLGSAVGSFVPAFLAGGLAGSRAARAPVPPRSILGALLAGYAAAVVYKRTRPLPVETSDGFVRGTAAMMALGRLSCHFQHCCVGIVAPPGFPGVGMGDGRPRVPVQLLEFTLLSGLFFLFHYLHRTGRLRDRRLFLFFFLYGVTRFLLETLREPMGATACGIGAYQWLALMLVLVGALEILRRTPGTGTTLPGRMALT